MEPKHECKIGFRKQNKKSISTTKEKQIAKLSHLVKKTLMFEYELNQGSFIPITL
jgi:methyl coenzyme M reductase subunit D